ncbi:MAG: bifunctional diaminohydroxyphosphoribosylaminopyrimidine deaminase/5-amino-6-(5-phosphoribosylamino)uracil reductase RibD [Planctomycetota bacterium]
MIDDRRERDESLMRKAILLAEFGRGRVEPNPRVGAIVARGDRCVGRGWHARFGGPHAEPNALAEAGDAAEGATVYVTLEPCAHEAKKTPPCTQALIDAKVARVVIAAEDPNPQTTGLGSRRLQEAGIEVTTGVLADEAAKLNPRFEHWLSSGRPFVIAKWAMTLDGKIADVERGSKYITGPDSRRLVHEIRGSVDAVAVGVGTVLADDPDLTVRDVTSTREPVRVILDSTLRTPVLARVVTSSEVMPTWIVTTARASAEKRQALESAGCRVLVTEAEAGHVDLGAAFRLLKAEGLSRILLEGGGEVHTSAFRAGVVDHVMAFVAPKLLGGRAAPGPLGGDGVRLIADPLPVEEWTTTPLGEDVLLEGFIDPA